MIGSILHGLHAALSASSSLTQVTAWYHAQAPGSAVEPYGIIQIAAGGDTNDNPLDELDEDWIVKVIDADAARAMVLADAIRSTLHNASLTLGAGWTCYDCEHSGPPFFYDEEVERTRWWHAGSTFRIRAFKDG